MLSVCLLVSVCLSIVAKSLFGSWETNAGVVLLLWRKLFPALGLPYFNFFWWISIKLSVCFVYPLVCHVVAAVAPFSVFVLVIVD